MIYEIEDFITELDLYFKESLNPAITAKNTAKGDNLLTLFNVKSFFIQTLDERVNNYPQFFMIQAGNPTLDDSVRGSIVETYPVAVLIGLSSNNLDEKNAARIFRYNSIIKDLILKGFWKVSPRSFKVNSLDLMSLVELDATRAVISTGLSLEVSFGF